MHNSELVFAELMCDESWPVYWLNIVFQLYLQNPSTWQYLAVEVLSLVWETVYIA